MSSLLAVRGEWQEEQEAVCDGCLACVGGSAPARTAASQAQPPFWLSEDKGLSTQVA